METISSLAKRAAEYTRKPKSKEPREKLPPAKSKNIVDMDSTSGFLADILTPHSWGGERAGRTQAMADAIGEKTTFSVRHPLINSLPYALIGGALGNVAGLGATGLYNYATGRHPESNSFAEASTSLPALTGSILGANLGSGLSGLFRRNEMKRINHFFDEDQAQDKVKPQVPNLSLLSAALLPFRGQHRTGQIEAYNRMIGNKSIPEQRGYLRDTVNTAVEAGNVLGKYAPGITTPAALLSTLQGYGQNIKTQLAARKLKKEKQKEQSSVSDLAKSAAANQAAKHNSKKKLTTEKKQEPSIANDFLDLYTLDTAGSAIADVIHDWSKSAAVNGLSYNDSDWDSLLQQPEAAANMPAGMPSYDDSDWDSLLPQQATTPLHSQPVAQQTNAVTELKQQPNLTKQPSSSIMPNLGSLAANQLAKPTLASNMTRANPPAQQMTNGLPVIQANKAQAIRPPSLGTIAAQRPANGNRYSRGASVDPAHPYAGMTTEDAVRDFNQTTNSAAPTVNTGKIIGDRITENLANTRTQARQDMTGLVDNNLQQSNQLGRTMGGAQYRAAGRTGVIPPRGMGALPSDAVRVNRPQAILGDGGLARRAADAQRAKMQRGTTAYGAPQFKPPKDLASVAGSNKPMTTSQLQFNRHKEQMQNNTAYSDRINKQRALRTAQLDRRNSFKLK